MVKNKKLLYGILIAAVLVILGTGIAYLGKPKLVINSFEDCAKAGYPVLQSYPRRCQTPGGIIFSEFLKERADLKATGIANPASVYCEEHGGKLDIRTKTEGQYGVCIFNDSSECEEWAFYRDECKKGEKVCKDLCGDGVCQEVVCMAVGCPCPESPKTCPRDCK